MSHATENTLASWSVPQCPFVIDYLPRVLDEIRLIVVDAFFSLPRGGAEIGGLLLGQYASGRLLISGYVPVECEHAFGPSYTLSDRDRASLEEALASAYTHSLDAQPVGWFHSHTRSDIFLSDADRDLHERYFIHPWQVALVFRPHTFQPTRAGFFFRDEKGEIYSQHSYREFEVSPTAFAPSADAFVDSQPPAPPVSAPPPPAPEPEPAPEPPPPARSRRAAFVDLPPEPEPEALPPLRPEPPPMPEPPPQRAESSSSRPAAAPPLPEPLPKRSNPSFEWLAPLTPAAEPPSQDAEPPFSRPAAPPPTPEPPLTERSESAFAPAEPEEPEAPAENTESIFVRPPPPPPRPEPPPPARQTGAYLNLIPREPETPAPDFEGLGLPAPAHAALTRMEEDDPSAVTKAEPPAEQEGLPRFLDVKVPTPKRRRRPVAIFLAAAVLGAGGYVTRGLWLNMAGSAMHSVLPGGRPPALGLRVLDSNGQLQIQWNAASAGLRDVKNARLIINDGAHQRSLPLDAAHLFSGAFTYARESPRVDVALAITPNSGDPFREQTTFFGRQPPAPPPDPQAAKDQTDLQRSNQQLKSDLDKERQRSRKMEREIQYLKDLRERELRQRRQERQ